MYPPFNAVLMSLWFSFQTAKTIGRKRGAVSLPDLLFTLRKDRKKYYRAMVMAPRFSCCVCFLFP